MTIALCRWCELAQHNNLLSIVHSRHDSCTSVRRVTRNGIQQLSRLVGAAAPATRVCITWMGVCGHEGSLGWLLPLDAAHHVQSNSVFTLCAVTQCFHEIALFIMLLA